MILVFEPTIIFLQFFSITYLLAFNVEGIFHRVDEHEVFQDGSIRRYANPATHQHCDVITVPILLSGAVRTVKIQLERQ